MNLSLLFLTRIHIWYHNPVVIGECNAKSYNWYKDDKTTANGPKREIMISHNGLTQIINEPPHTLEDSLSCIDLAFTSQPKIVIDREVHS